MMWRKAWWELRSRVALAAGICLAYAFVALASLTKPGQALGVQLGWEDYCQVVAGFIAPMVALVLAGSGINAQTSWGIRQGFHPSMYFLLSMPVSRTRALLIRTGLAALLVVVFILVLVGGVGLVARASGLPLPWQHVLASCFYLTAGTFVLFSLETYLSTFLDELWAGMIGWGLVGAFCGAAYTLRDLRVKFTLLDFVIGKMWNDGGYVGWGYLLLFGTLISGFLWAAIFVVEGKEF